MIRPRRTVRTPLGLVAALALLGATGGGCAHPRIVDEALDDGSHRLTCRTPLPICLNEGAGNLCQGRNYVVLRAIDEHNLRGMSNAPLDDRTSEAIVRCGPSTGWGALGKPMEAPLSCEASSLGPPAPGGPSATLPPAAPRERVCVPGVTQACVGVAACNGGQACLSDGSAFGKCECAGPALVPATPYP